MDPQRLTVDRNDRLDGQKNNHDVGSKSPKNAYAGVTPFIFGGAILGISVLLWGLWQWTAPKGDGIGDDLPVIRAPDGPIKMKAGGDAAAPGQERMVYQKLESSESVPGVEHLLSEPEEPQSRPPSLPDDFIGEMIGEGDVVSEQSVDTVPNAAATAVIAPEHSNPTAAPVSAMPTPDVPKTWMVHLGSLTTKEAAHKEMDRLTGNPRLKDALRVLNPQITAAKNTKTFLLKAGPLSKKDADNLCVKIQSERGNCLVRRKTP